jgi:hypothetical protein
VGSDRDLAEPNGPSDAESLGDSALDEGKQMRLLFVDDRPDEVRIDTVVAGCSFDF